MTVKKWVFRELIKDENDYQGLLAYTCYKIEKDNLAQDLRDAGRSDKEVADALDKFHDASVTKRQLQEFKAKGLGVMKALTEALDADLISKHNCAIQTLKNQHQSALQQKDATHTKAIQQAVRTAKSDAKRDMLFKMQACSSGEVSRLIKTIKWVGNGFQSVIAVFILIFALHSLAYWSSDEATKSGVVSSFWLRVQNMFNSPIPASDVNSVPGG